MRSAKIRRWAKLAYQPMLVIGAVITLWIATPAYAEEKVNTEVGDE
ncbi:MAG: hypothetical protein BroJett021_18660 [Chloroflexota bacterium]|jgi:hypothetical protein|nr:hypothetical protein [Caldilinea sp.]GIK72878.1 MAG: hypothetical protein BroJett021_18660 [Chloroflexota bacterium]